MVCHHADKGRESFYLFDCLYGGLLLLTILTRKSIHADSYASFCVKHLYDFCLVLSFAAKGVAFMEGYRVKLADCFF